MIKFSKTKKVVSIVLSCAIFITGSIHAVNVRAASADAAFSTQMKQAGFPDSYIDSLASLHNAYPQWQFEAVQTGLDWNTVIEKESKNGVNLVPKSGDDARKSTASGA